MSNNRELKADLSEAHRFLKRLDPDAATWTFQTFDDNADRKDRRLARVMHGTLEQHGAELTRLQSQGAGIYVTVNETDGKGRTAKNVTRARAVFVDLDGAPLEPVKEWLPPHIITSTSPGRYHVFWRVEGLPLDTFTRAQKALIQRFHADPSVHDLPRVMRLPGFHHQKVSAKKGLNGVPYMVTMEDAA